ncbi:MAG TPA: acyl carrier protein [Polyangiales bacterium]
MECVSHRVFTVVDNVVPQPSALSPDDASRALSELGFDSMALVSLFIELEAEFNLSMQAMMGCLHKRCTLGCLLDLCASHAHAA